VKTTSNIHPSEDLLEKFACNRCSDEEIELVETHILACEACITKMEELDVFLAAFRPGFEQLPQRRAQTRGKLGLRWACGFASLATLGLVLSTRPRELNHTGRASPSIAQLQLSAERGSESASAPAFRPLRVRLNATDLPQKTLAVEVVNSVGFPVWSGSTRVDHDNAIVNLPPMPAGAYFVRLNGGSRDQSDLLREFALQVK
jgi:hypothetical protein